MKLQVIFLSSFIFLLFSCSNEVESIDVKSLSSPCECAKAAEIAINEQLTIREETYGKEFKDIDTSSLMPRIRTYKKKEDEIKKHCREKLAIGKCPEWTSIQKKLAERSEMIEKKGQEEALKKNSN